MVEVVAICSLLLVVRESFVFKYLFENVATDHRLQQRAPSIGTHKSSRIQRPVWGLISFGRQGRWPRLVMLPENQHWTSDITPQLDFINKNHCN